MKNKTLLFLLIVLITAFLIPLAAYLGRGLIFPNLKTTPPQAALTPLTPPTIPTFKASDQVSFTLKLDQPKKTSFLKIPTAYAQTPPTQNTWQDEDLKIETRLTKMGNVEKDVSVQINQEKDDQFSFSLHRQNPLAFNPGLYKLETTITGSEGQQTKTWEFAWGVLAVNTNKSVFTPGEKVYLQMASLNEYGKTLCDADLKLEVTDPAGSLTSLTPSKTLSEVEGQTSPTCGQDNVTDNPDYFAYYQLPANSQLGTYHIKLTNNDTGYSIDDSFEVASTDSAQARFSVERIGATRINPFKTTYTMNIKITANEDFEGEIVESVPSDFKIENSDLISNFKFQISNSKDNKQNLIWNVKLSQGQTLPLSYTYQAPKVSPEIFLLGPLVILKPSSVILNASEGSLDSFQNKSGDSSSKTPQNDKRVLFTEARSWQLASDAACNATGDGTWGGTDTANFTSCTGAASGGTGTGNRPGSADDLTIDNGINITLSVDATINSLVINTTSVATDLTHASSTIDLTVTTTVNIVQGTGANDNGNWAINAGTGTVGGTLTLTETNTNTNRDALLTLTTGTLNANGGITCSGTTAGAKTVTIGASGSIKMKGALTGNAGCTLSQNATGIFSYSDSAAAQTTDISWGSGAHSLLYFNNTHANGVTLDAAITTTNVTENVVVQTGTFKNGGFAIAGNTTKTFQVDNGATFSMSATSTFPTGFQTFTFAANSTVIYGQTGDMTATDQDYGNLEFKSGDAATTFTLPAGTINISGNLVIGDDTNATTVTATANDPNVSVSGNVTVNTGSTMTNSDLSTATLNIDSNLTIDSTSTFTAPAGTANTAFTLRGNFTNNGTFNDNNGRLTLDGDGLSYLIYSANTTFHDLNVITGGKVIQFDEAQTTVIESGGNFIIQGTNCATGMIRLTSYVDNDQWPITVTGATVNIDYADIEDSNATPTAITADNSTQVNGGNTNWTVNPYTTCGTTIRRIMGGTRIKGGARIK